MPNYRKGQTVFDLEQKRYATIVATQSLYISGVLRHFVKLDRSLGTSPEDVWRENHEVTTKPPKLIDLVHSLLST